MSDQEVTLDIATDFSKAIRDMAAFQRGFLKSMEKMADSVKDLAGSMEGMSAASKKGSKKAVEGVEEQTEAIKTLADQVKELEAQSKALERADSAHAIARKRDLDRRIETTKKLVEAQEAAEANKAGAGGSGRVGKADLLAGGAKSAYIKAGSVLGKAGGKDLAHAFKSASSRDFKEAGKHAGQAFKKLVGGAGGLSSAGGNRLLGAASRMGGSAAGSLGKGNMVAAGAKGLAAGGMGALGGIMKGLGPMLKMIGQMGPLLSMAGGMAAGIVKLFIDAHSQAKEFNKALLQGVGTAGFLAQAGGNVDLAYSNLSDTLEGVRNAAHSLDNMKWGINAEDHQNFINSLTTEGIRLESFGADAARLGKSIEEFSGGLVHDAVTASRMLGVSVQEIGQYQAEMMTDLGSNVEDVNSAFAQMAQSAGDSGIATNKFFAMIRGVSADLSLFDNRMGTAVKLLGNLGKVMSARNAQKFLQGAAAGLKGMDQDSRFKMTMIAGTEKTKKILEADFADQTKDLANAASAALKMPLEEAQKMMSTKGGSRQLALSLSKAGQGDLSEGVRELGYAKSGVKKGPWGVGAASRQASMGASLDIKGAALTALTGVKSIGEGIGTLGQDKVQQLLGMTEEEVHAMAMLEDTVADQKDSMIATLTNGTAEEKAAVVQQLQAAGVQGQTAEEMLKSIQDGSVSTNQVYKTLGTDQQKAIEDAGKSQHDLAVAQVAATDTVADKIERIMQFIMNQLFNVLVDVWDAVTSLADWGGDKADKKAKLAMLKSGDQTLVRAANSGSVKGAFAGGDVGKRYVESLGTSEGRSKAMAAANSMGSEGIMKLARMAGQGGNKKLDNILTDQLNKTGKVDIESAASKAGMDPKALDDMLKQLLWVSDSAATQFRLYNELGLDGKGAKPAATAGFENAFTQSSQGGPAQAAQAAQAAKAAQAAQPAAQPATSQSAVSESKDAKTTGTYGLQAPAIAAAESGSLAADSMDKLLGQNQDIERRLAQTGVKVEKGFLNSDYYRVLKDATYESFSKALFEFALYSKLGAGELTNMARQPGFNASTAGSNYLNQVTSGKNARGGLVTGIGSDGIARVNPASGEGLASIGVGERIVPGGSSGAPTVSVTVAGIGGNELARLIEAKVADGIYEYKRREGYTS